MVDLDSRLTRRDLMKQGAAAFCLTPLASAVWAAPAEAGTPIPFLDPQPMDPKRPMLKWEELDHWITPNDQVFAVSHYGAPAKPAAPWSLEVSGLVTEPRSFSLSDIRSRPRQAVTAVLECSGNGAGPTFMGAIGCMRWSGTPLAPLLRECGVHPRAIEVVFFGADEGTETIRNAKYRQHFARSLSLTDALHEDVLLADTMNGEPLSHEHGGPVRLIVPGWLGIAWAKWLTRIELLDRRYENRFMGRDYVTIRGEERDGQTVWRETSVGPIDLKSIVARAERLGDGTVRLHGAAWTDGTRLKGVEVRIDGGPWTPVRLERRRASYAWTFWTHDWQPQPGEHTLVSRAIDAQGRVQPAPDDPAIALKKTYWEANQQVVRRIRV